jgi:SSS family solute:Na+ symporter
MHMVVPFHMIGLLTGMDSIVFIACVGALIFSGIRRSAKRAASGYFMADRQLPWWSVACSIYGTNVSLSQIIGMLGIGYSIGFAQSHYELLAIPMILLLCHVFIPAYRKKQAFTLSEFLGDRYNETARFLYTIIIISVIIILLVGGLYIGSRQLGLLLSGTFFQPGYFQGIVLIACIACLLVFYGGMHAVVRAENIITVLMVLAVITVGVCTLMQPEIGGFSGLLELDASARGMNKMKLYLPSDHPDLPWTGVFSGLLVLHGFFWTTNQFEVQRVLAARSDRDAQLGAIAAGFLKLTIPFFSISAGVAAAYLFKYKYGMTDVKPDDAFVYLMEQVVPKGYGLMGLILAGFLGAIFSSIYSMLNSLSTITAIDVYKRYVDGNASDTRLVAIGKISVVIACLIGVSLAWWSFSPTSEGNFFLTLSKNTSYLKPGIVSAFFLGVLWKRTHPLSAGIAILAAPVLSVVIELVYDHWLGPLPQWRAVLGEQLNFMHRVFVVFTCCVLIQVVVSMVMKRKGDAEHDSFEAPVKMNRTIYYIVINALFLMVISTGSATAPQLSVMAAVFSLLVLIDYKNLRNAVFFWGALLMAIMTWALYYFV